MASEVAAVVAAAPGVRPSEAERAALQMLRAARSLPEAQLLPVAARQLSVPALSVRLSAQVWTRL